MSINFINKGNNSEYSENLLLTEKILYTPQEYIDLEYIESNGTQVVQTDIIPTHHKTEIKFQMLSLVNNTFILGCNYYHAGYYNYGLFSAFYNGQEKNIASGSVLANLNTLILNDSQHRTLLNNTVLATDFQDTPSLSSKLCLFSRGSNYSGYYSSTRIYYVKITDNNTNELVVDFVPILNKNTEEVGFLDKVSGVIYYPYIGKLIAGPAKEV